MTYTRRTEHGPDALKFIVDGPDGPLELRINSAFAAVVDDQGEAEMTPGGEIAALWCAAGHDDAVIWPELERLHDERAAARDVPASPPHPELKAAADWADFAAEHGTPADAAEADDAHLEILRRVLRQDTQE